MSKFGSCEFESCKFESCEFETDSESIYRPDFYCDVAFPSDLSFPLFFFLLNVGSLKGTGRWGEINNGSNGGWKKSIMFVTDSVQLSFVPFPRLPLCGRLHSHICPRPSQRHDYCFFLFSRAFSLSKKKKKKFFSGVSEGCLRCSEVDGGSCFPSPSLSSPSSLPSEVKSFLFFTLRSSLFPFPSPHPPLPTYSYLTHSSRSLYPSLFPFPPSFILPA